MRRRWPALAATIPLVLGLAVAAAHPASANGQPLAAFRPTEIVMPSTSVSAINSAGGFTVSYTGFGGFPGFGWSGPGRPASD